MTLIQRLQSPTPSFFKKVRKIGLILTAISGAVFAGSAALPAVLVSIAAYLGIAGSVASAVSQAATEEEGTKTSIHRIGSAG